MLFCYFLTISLPFSLYLGMIFENLTVFAWDRLASLITSSLLTLKASNLVKWQLWTWSFMRVVSIYWVVKIWNSPQFSAQFRNGQLRVDSRMSLAFRCTRSVNSVHKEQRAFRECSASVAELVQICIILILYNFTC